MSLIRFLSQTFFKEAKKSGKPMAMRIQKSRKPETKGETKKCLPQTGKTLTPNG